MDQLTMQLVMIGGFMAIAYFLLIKPQKKRQKAMMDMRESLKKGDDVVTIGGIKGTVVNVTDTDVVIETSSDRTKMEFVKSAIHSIVSKSEESSEEVEEDMEEENSEEN
ncbi:preprotein translocase, YajC subunit [Parvimonas sp. KA00067]|uniref:preprotein translocase subunit YajC n=1 Tax=Parvimonas sp. KA00067 TaxID=1588755 RepID=UPI0007999F0D|nr:preprotein translocase subunit YajC [Parvimonas sp. KA00067]KXB67462.1 preprotein translocase, YajC subunit [Parvimonas sp. KA00067]